MEEVKTQETDEAQETVDVSTLDDAELDEMIERSGEKDKDAEPQDETPAPEEAEGETSEKKETPSETPPEEKEGETEQSEVETLRRQLQDKESFIQRQASEIGELRKFTSQEDADPPSPTAEENEDDFFDNPKEAVSKTVERVIEERDRKQAFEVERIRLLGEETKSMVTEAVPDFKDFLDDISELAKEDGYTDENLAAFKADPFISSDPGILISYAKRAQMKRQLSEYEREISELKKKPEEVVKRIQEAAGKNGTTLTGKTASMPRGTRPEISEPQIASMSDAELDEALKQAQ